MLFDYKMYTPYSNHYYKLGTEKRLAQVTREFELRCVCVNINKNTKIP